MELPAYALTALTIARGTFRAAKHLYQRGYAWWYRPPTPSQTAEAIQHMTAVRNQLDVFFDKEQTAWKKDTRISGPTVQRANLAKITKLLRIARRRDPDAVLEYEVEKKRYRLTQDSLAAELLSIESQTYELEGKNTFAKAYPPYLFRSMRRDQKRAFRKALKAVEKAEKYLPDNETILLQKATCLFLCGYKLRAWWLMRRIRKMFPDSLEVLQKMQELR